LDETLELVLRSHRTGVAAAPFANPALREGDAYRVQYRLIAGLLEQGETISGHKVALTTAAARSHLGVNEPCYGHILDQGVYPNDSDVPVGDLAEPHAEAEIAFLFGEDLKGPGVTPVHVIRATEAVLPAIELVDLKVQTPGIQAVDVIAHNALHGGVVVGSRLNPLDTLDLQFEGVTVDYNGEHHGSGTGSEVMGNPINPIVWLANKLAEFDDYLKAGEIVISGSIVTPVKIKPGDHVKVTYTRLGAVGARFV
jgi:2-keto-4-pentenoate hydratase